jgi:hypothetical protein
MAQLEGFNDNNPWWMKEQVGKVQAPAAESPGGGPSMDSVAPGVAPAASGGGGGGGNSGGVLSFSAPSMDFRGVPQFNAAKFRAPSAQEVLTDPGYMFRLQTGTDAMEKSAAARGVLRTGGTLKDLIQYGQNFATQEYQNVYDRALKSHGANYQIEKDAYAPQFQEWMAQFNADRAMKMAAFQHANNMQMSAANRPAAPFEPMPTGGAPVAFNPSAPQQTVFMPGQQVGKL